MEVAVEDTIAEFIHLGRLRKTTKGPGQDNQF
jgi:hypothetical protein